MSEKRAQWFGVAAGGAVLLGAVAAGGILWQGTVFDQQFEEIARKLSDDGVKVGLSISAEEIARSFTGREVAITVKDGQLAFRWTGRATFGFGTKAKLTLDREFGSAPELPNFGLDGYEDQIKVNVGLTGDATYEWTVKPFRVKDDPVLCSVAGFTLTADKHLKKTDLLWHGMTCQADEERLVTGPVSIKAHEDGAEGRIEVQVKGGELTSQGVGGLVTVEGYTLHSLQTRQKVNESQTETTTPPLYEQQWTWTLSQLKLDGQTALDGWKGKVRLENVPESFIAQMATGALVDVEMLMPLILSNDLKAKLEECVFERQQKQVSITGQLARESNQLGSFTVNIDREFAQDEPVWTDSVKELVSEGALRESEGAWVSQIDITEEGILVNGRVY